METHKHGPSLAWWSLLLLLLGLLMPPAIAQDLTYREAVLRAVDAFNQQSSEANLYRLLSMDPQPLEDEKPYTPQPVSFTVKETECPRTTWKLPEQCDFKEDGLVKRCVGTVTRYQAWDSFDIRCNRRARETNSTHLLGARDQEDKSEDVQVECWSTSALNIIQP